MEVSDMAISSYQKNGATFFRVRAQYKSPRFASIRLTEQVSGLRSRIEAEKAETKLTKELERRAHEQEVRRSILGQTFGAVLDDWYRVQMDVRVPFGSVQPETVKDYYQGLRKWMADFKHVPCSNITPLDLMQLFNKLSEEGRSFAHRQRLRTVLKSVFDHGIKAGLVSLTRNPAHDLQLKKSEEKKPEILTIVEIRKLVEVAFARQHDWRHVWALALLTGMRNGELFALQWSDVDWERKLITVSRSFNCRTKTIGSTKAGHWRDVPISEDCRRLLLELRQSASRAAYVLLRLPRWDHGIQAAVLRTFCLENGLPSVRFHTLRACFGTQLLRQGISAAVVMKIAGWRDLKTMQRYIRLAGIEVAGATDGLSVLPPEEAAANVVAFRPKSSS
jgi:integrase